MNRALYTVEPPETDEQFHTFTDADIRAIPMEQHFKEMFKEMFTREPVEDFELSWWNSPLTPEQQESDRMLFNKMLGGDFFIKS